MKKTLYYLLPLVIYSALLFLVSAGKAPEVLPSFWNVDKLYHLAGYAVMGVLVTRTALAYLASGGRVHTVGRLVVFAAASSFLFGGLIEIYQAYIPYREGDPVDAVINGAGGLLGAYIYLKCIRVIRT